MTPTGLTEADLEDFAGRMAAQPGGLQALSDDKEFAAFIKINLLDKSPGGPTPGRVAAIEAGRGAASKAIGERLGVSLERTYRGVGGRFLSTKAKEAGAKVTGSIGVVRDTKTGRFLRPQDVAIPTGQFRSGARRRRV